MDDLLLVGRVARAHGNRGQVIVNPETDFPEDRFTPGRVLYVGAGDRARRVVAVRFQQGRPVIALEGIDSMDAAEALAGTELKISAADLAPLPPATFYRHDLVGCDVRTREGASIGHVTAVEGPMERSYLVVTGASGELLIPLVDGICVSVDPRAQEIVVDPPQGLLELNETPERPSGGG
ncbi:MAG TPA: ribosome maturation factor RimM [Vicinamibacterales bacterium]|jgi:16S rRNA processing protein RimM